jgi:hypothetical protein
MHAPRSQARSSNKDVRNQYKMITEPERRGYSTYIKWRGGRHRFEFECVVGKHGGVWVAITRSSFESFIPRLALCLLPNSLLSASCMLTVSFVVLLNGLLLAVMFQSRLTAPSSRVSTASTPTNTGYRSVLAVTDVQLKAFAHWCIQLLSVLIVDASMNCLPVLRSLCLQSPRCSMPMDSAPRCLQHCYMTTFT